MWMSVSILIMGMPHYKPTGPFRVEQYREAINAQIQTFT
jgi:hypothetical protein